MAIIMLAIGAVLSAIGLYAIVSGYPMIEIERGWASVIAGSVLLSGGLVVVALGLVLRALMRMHAALPTLATIAPPGVASVVMEPSFAPVASVPHEAPLDTSFPVLAVAVPAAAAALATGYGARLETAATAAPPEPEAPAPAHDPHATTRGAAEPIQASDWDDRAFAAFDYDAEPEVHATPARHEEPSEAHASPHADEHPEFASETIPGTVAPLHKPVVQEPVIQEPVIHEPVIHKPVVLQPVVDEPVVHEPVVYAPAIQEPEVEGPEPAAQDSLFHEPPPHPAELGELQPHPVAVAEPADHPHGPEPDYAQAAAHDESAADAPATAPETPPANLAVIGRYDSEGTSYVMYSDGSIEAQSEAGIYRFGSMAELKAFIEG